MILKYLKKLGLKSQLVIVTLATTIISFISLIIILPNLLIPFYENNLYEILRQPLNFIQADSKIDNENVAFIIYDNSRIIISDNFRKLLYTDNIEDIIVKITGQSGKFKYNSKTYYYSMSHNRDGQIITIADDTYIKNQKNSLSKIIIPTLSLTLLSALIILIYYSNYLVKKISIIKLKVDNINNDNFNHQEQFAIKDELASLINRIEKMRLEIKEKEDYKNNMFQSISHELKTPIMVITSHIEAANDKIITDKKALMTIKDEANNLSKKVGLILQLNKINFLKKQSKSELHKIDIIPLLNKSIKKYQIFRPDLKFILKTDNHKFIGTDDMWQIIIDNIFSNFMRYAHKKIEITITKKNLQFYNDGPAIEEEIIKDIFSEYKKGTNGNLGLGLAITKNTLELFGYNINVVNQKKGVSFIIE